MNGNNWPLGDAENGLSFFRRRMLDKNYCTQQLWSVSYDLSKNLMPLDIAIFGIVSKILTNLYSFL